MDLKSYIRKVPDFPRSGILFYDISTLFAHAGAFSSAVAALADLAAGYSPDLIAGVEARGFPLAAPVALALGVGMLLVRKPGKLPGPVLRHEYTKEYGTDALEIPASLVLPGARVLIVDDVLATGGTFRATVALVRQAGATVPAGLFLAELTALGGRAESPVPVASLVRY